MDFEKQLTRVNGHAINGRSVVKAVMKIPIQKIRTFMSTRDIDSFKGVTSGEITLESTSNEVLQKWIGKEVVLSADLKTTLPSMEIFSIDNPRSIKNIMELLEGTKGKIVNDLITEHVEVTVWKFFLVWDSDIAFLIDNDLKTISEGSLIPELEGRELADGEADEVSLLKVDMTNTKVKDINITLEKH